MTVEGRVAIGVMAKAPRAGHVKTRLVPPLTPEEAMRMSGHFLRDITENLRQAALRAPIDPFIAYAPEGSEELFDGLLAAGTRLVLADGRGRMPEDVLGFGRCLLHATEAMFALGYGGVCLLNADSPTLPTDLLCQAADALLRPGRRAVLGPADDGGYYLLGMQDIEPHLFADISWSTELVAGQTRQRAAESGLDVENLAGWYDVDDLQALHQLLQPAAIVGLVPYAAPSTSAFAREMDLAARLAAAAR
jgi:rSAM/selenodomain-associated transferase 1